MLTRSTLRTYSLRIFSTSGQYNEASTRPVEKNPKPFSDIPQPKGLPLLGTFLDYTKGRGFEIERVHEFFLKRHEKLGPIYKENPIPGLAPTTVYLSAPEDVEVAYRNEEKWPHRPTIEPIARGRALNNLSQGVTNTQGEEWYRLRKFYNENLLTNEIISLNTGGHLKIGRELAQYIEKNMDANKEVPNFDHVLQMWALECTALFSVNAKIGMFTGGVSEEAEVLIRAINKLFGIWADLMPRPPIWKYFMTKKAKELKKLQKEEIDALEYFIEVQNKKHGKSKFQKVIEESNLTPEDKRVIVSDVLGAGVDTTAAVAAFVVYCLASNPDKQEILRSEINELLASNEEITGRDIQRMKYMHAVVLETQRLFPIAIFFQRKFPVDLVLSGYKVPADTLVQFNANLTNNRDPTYFKDPDKFIPERWLDKSQSKGHRFVLSGTFGTGSRKCPGRRFAIQEVETLVIGLLSRFRMEYHHEPISLRVRLLGVPSEPPRCTFIPLKN